MTEVSLEEARRRLRELGYLNGGVERFVFRRAFAGRGGLFVPAVLLSAFAAAIASVAAVAAGEPGFGESPTAVGALLLHLFFADLPATALLAAVLALAADQSRSPAGAATFAGLTAAGAVFFLWIGGAYSLSRDIPARAFLWGIPVALAAMLAARSVRSGFLARAYARSRVLPGEPRRRVFLAAVITGVVAAVLLLGLRPRPAPARAPLPSPRSMPVVVAAVDGLSLDSSSAGGISGIRGLLVTGVTGWWPARQGVPPEIWSDLATGEPASHHGVRALARVRPAGSPLGVRPPLGTAWYLRRLAPALKLASSAPVSAADRRRLAFWEVAASAGIPAVSVGWWASGPWPGCDVVRNEDVLAGASGGLTADARALGEFEKRRRGGQGIATVYLPGLDILRDSNNEERIQAAEQVHRFLENEVSRAVAREEVLVILAADSHPAPSALGRMVVFDGRQPVRTIQVRAEDAAPSILSRAGVPAATDLTGR
ncbi:MAG TPA: hypothetical protein VKG01_16035, partial [Thermoanaerobaculia bacterium]|nr:hypothetical protein [Thermoanaerobaculia bacterium]